MVRGRPRLPNPFVKIKRIFGRKVLDGHRFLRVRRQQLLAADPMSAVLAQAENFSAVGSKFPLHAPPVLEVPVESGGGDKTAKSACVHNYPALLDKFNEAIPKEFVLKVSDGTICDEDSFQLRRGQVLQGFLLRFGFQDFVFQIPVSREGSC